MNGIRPVTFETKKRIKYNGKT